MSFPHVRLAEEVGQDASQCSGDSPDSSLAVSPLSTHRTNCESLASTGADSTKPAISTLFAKLDVSDILAPLEARLFERLDTLEAMLERRCGALECRVGVLTAAAAATSDSGGFQQQLKVLQAQMEATMGSLQSYMEKESVRMSGLTEGLKACGEKQSSLQTNIDEVWRQLKANRQEALTNHQSLSDTIEPRLRGILDKVDRRCSDLGGLLADDAAGGRAERALGSPPAPIGRLASSPPLGSRQVLAEDTLLAGRLPSAGQQAPQLRPEAASPTHASPAPLLSMPASPQLQHRSLVPPTSPGAQPQPAGACPAEPERLHRHSTPVLPLRMRSVEALQGTGGTGTPSSLAARAALPAQRSPPVQRMASGSRPSVEVNRGGGSGGLRPPQAAAPLARSARELPRP